MTIPSYPKVWHLGQVPLYEGTDQKDLLAGSCVVQEKVDGSQISFGLIDGDLMVRSKNTDLITQPNGMFDDAIASIERAKLTPGIIYRGEYLQKPKHNTLKYERVPRNGIAIFDAFDTEELWWLDVSALRVEADETGFDTVPMFFTGPIESMQDLDSLMERESFLGGEKIEGVVIKRYDIPNRIHSVTFCKYVSERFKERHGKDWKNRNPSGKDFVEQLASEFASEARFTKAIQHLRERGEITDSPKDIGPLMKELSEDFESEWVDEVKNRLWAHFRKTILSGASRGAPEWYKRELAAEAFEQAA